MEDITKTPPILTIKDTDKNSSIEKKIKTHDFALTVHSFYIVANTIATVMNFMMKEVKPRYK